MSFFSWIRILLGGKQKPTHPVEPKEEKPAILDDRRKDAVSARNGLKSTSTDWYRLNAVPEVFHKEIPIYIPYSCAEIVTLKDLKEERIKKEKARLAALTNEANTILSEVEFYVGKENLEAADTLLGKVAASIPKIRDSQTVWRYKDARGSVETLRKRLERRRLQKLAEERRAKEEEERKRLEREERERREREEQARKDRERREAEAQRLAKQAREKEQAEIAERQRLQSLCEEKKEYTQAFKNILMSNGIRCFYHFTDRRNLPSIKRHGGLLSWYYCKEHDIDIPCQGGDTDSEKYDKRYGLEDFVRLSFCSDHPMAYRLKQNGSNLVLLKVKIDVAWFKGTMFSDINAADSRHSHGGDLEDLQKVDFRATQKTYVRKDDEDFKPHQAEVMVKTFIPLEYIINIDSPQQI